MGDANVVLVSPDGPLHGLPFAALPGDTPGRYLLERFVFAVVPIPLLLPELLAAPAGRVAAPSALVVGDVDFGGSGRFPPLAGTAAEAREVAALFRAGPTPVPVTALAGAAATKAAFADQAARHSHLLVATHGFFEPERDATKAAPPMGVRAAGGQLVNADAAAVNPAVRSGLVFAGANGSAGNRGEAFLTALDVGELDLRRSDLVVLSACETGLGQVRQSDGIPGLQRAFQLAGARTTVASLWKVPDDATRALMVRFHENLLAGRGGKPLGRGEALREAQRWVISDWAAANPDAIRGTRSGITLPAAPDWRPGDPVPPHLWAAFVLSGDWR